jgi:elongation factor Ts
VLLQLSSETDFVAKSEPFQQLAKQLCMHIAAAKPLFVRAEDVDAAMLEKEREFARKEALEQGKPAEMVERIVEGKVKKVLSDWVLLDQPFVIDPDRTVAQAITDVQGCSVRRSRSRASRASRSEPDRTAWRADERRGARR